MPTGVYKRTDEMRKRMSESAMGKIVSVETRKKLSKAHLGKTKSEETKKKTKIKYRSLSEAAKEMVKIACNGCSFKYKDVL